MWCEKCDGKVEVCLELDENRKSFPRVKYDSCISKDWNGLYKLYGRLCARDGVKEMRKM